MGTIRLDLTTKGDGKVNFIGVELGGPTARTSPVLGPHARYRIQGGRQHMAVVAIGAAQRQAKRRALGIRDEVALRARLAAVRRVRPNLGAPLVWGSWCQARSPPGSHGKPDELGIGLAASVRHLAAPPCIRSAHGERLTNIPRAWANARPGERDPSF